MIDPKDIGMVVRVKNKAAILYQIEKIDEDGPSHIQQLKVAVEERKDEQDEPIKERLRPTNDRCPKKCRFCDTIYIYPKRLENHEKNVQREQVKSFCILTNFEKDETIHSNVGNLN